MTTRLTATGVTAGLSATGVTATRVTSRLTAALLAATGLTVLGRGDRPWDRPRRDR
ncbi:MULTISPECIES: hypothetical protein [Nocardia]|uniref:hypothetical protein n=1 Tax=Nocardia abscessus TaxID=120957 RepID=UPI001893B2B0|nr:hypothetical protein [Nocardia abscessus]